MPILMNGPQHTISSLYSRGNFIPMHNQSQKRKRIRKRERKKNLKRKIIKTIYRN